MKAFHLIHVEVGQTLFIFLALALWLVWAWWATRGRSLSPDALA